MEAEIQNSKPTSEQLISQAREFDQNKSDLKSEPKVGKKRGPYKQREKSAKTENRTQASDAGPQKPENEAPKFNIPTKALCYPIVKAVSGAGVAYTREPKAAITAEEAEGMAEALGMVLDKYLPDVASKYGPELVCAVAFGQYGLRIYAIKQLQIREMAMRAQTQQQTANDGPRPNNAPPANLSVVSEESPVP